MGIKIDGNKGFGSMLEAQKARKSEPAKQPAGVKPQDKVEFSAVLKGVAQNREVASAAAAERAEKLKSLQSQIDSGNYRPDLDKVAASLLRFIDAEKGS